MGWCSAYGCSNSSGPNMSMKVFPRDPSRRAVWIAAVKRKNWSPSQNSRLCQEHFEPDQFEKPDAEGKIKLKNNAVPTIFTHKKLQKRRPPPSVRAPAPKRQKTDLALKYGNVGSLDASSVQKNGNNLVPQSSSQKFEEEFVSMEDVQSRIKKEPEDDEYIAKKVFEDIKSVLNIKQEIIDEDNGLPVITSYGSLATVPPPTSTPQLVTATRVKQKTTKNTMQNVAAVFVLINVALIM